MPPTTTTSPGMSLGDRLATLTAVADPALVEPLPDGRLRCLACGHRCPIPPGRSGVCRVRSHRDGVLRVPFGYVAGLGCDPIEKKPFFHVLPGSDALTFGMLGCDLHCGFCQNWVTSQALRDPAAVSPVRPISAEQVVELAVASGARVVASSYNEPLITSEWAAAVFDRARSRGLLCAYVSNGNATPQVLDYLRPRVQAYKVDLKCFTEAGYRGLGGSLKNVLDTIVGLKARGFWVELVTLVVPGLNDDAGQLAAMARFIAGVDRLIPWHLTAFHPDYQMTDGHHRTPSAALRVGVDAGRSAGLEYVYVGNCAGELAGLEDTRCHGCGTSLVRRRGFTVLESRVGVNGRCPSCGESIPGLWKA